jgi:hypothetical protein
MLLANAAMLALLAAPASFDTPDELQVWLTYYHHEPRPELVPAALSALERELPRHGSSLEAEAGRGGMRAFFGHVLAQSPAAVAAVTRQDFAPGTRRFVAEALRRCGTPACAGALERWGMGAGAPAPDVRVAPVDSRSVIDDLWASYSATGDRVYVDRVIATLPPSAALVASAGEVATAALRSLTASAIADPDVLALCVEAAAAADPGPRSVLEEIVRRARRARGDQTGS